MYQLEVSLCHALNSNNLFLRYPAGSIYIFSDLKEIKTAGKERKRSGKKQNEVKTKSKNIEEECFRMWVSLERNQGKWQK